MSFNFKNVSAEALLAIGGAYLFITSGTWMVFANLVEVDDCRQKMTNFECGQYYFNQGGDENVVYDLKKARKYYELAIMENPAQNKLLWYQLGRIDFLEGEFDEAIEKFDKQIEYFPGPDLRVYYMIGLTYGYKARKEDSKIAWVMAEENFKRVIRSAPEDAWPRVDLAWVYFGQGKFTEMLPVLEEGIDYEPNNPWLLNMYGLALYNTSAGREDSLRYLYRAREEASKLTAADWAKVYPGNSPQTWSIGIQEFKDTIEKNIILVE